MVINILCLVKFLTEKYSVNLNDFVLQLFSKF